MIYDALIVGAGPAGAHLACILSDAGKHVAIIDRTSFPRDKLCGGFLTTKALSLLSDSSPALGRSDFPILKVDAYYKEKLAAAISMLSPSKTVRRYEFDANLLSAARDKGANIFLSSPLTKIDFPRKEAYLSNGDKLLYDVLIGADGAQSTVRRLVNLPKNTMGFCLEAHVPWKQVKNTRNLRNGGIEIYYGMFPKGYGWLFPTKDTIAVGVGNLSDGMTEKEIIDCYDQFTRGVLLDSNTNTKGAYIPSGDTVILGSSSQENVCLIGDAAGLIDPFTGEGLYYALLSAQRVAEAIVSNKSLYPEYLQKMQPVINQIEDAVRVRNEVYSQGALEIAIAVLQSDAEYGGRIIDDTIINYSKSYSDTYEELKFYLR